MGASVPVKYVSIMYRVAGGPHSWRATHVPDYMYYRTDILIEA